MRIRVPQPQRAQAPNGAERGEIDNLDVGELQRRSVQRDPRAGDANVLALGRRRRHYGSDR
jgi:hypothetical protein